MFITFAASLEKVIKSNDEITGKLKYKARGLLYNTCLNTCPYPTTLEKCINFRESNYLSCTENR
jgi:hypothetical protein